MSKRVSGTKGKPSKNKGPARRRYNRRWRAAKAAGRKAEQAALEKLRESERAKSEPRGWQAKLDTYRTAAMRWAGKVLRRQRGTG